MDRPSKLHCALLALSVVTTLGLFEYPSQWVKATSDHTPETGLAQYSQNTTVPFLDSLGQHHYAIFINNP